ncbi:MAG: hypothetical protein V4441_06700 [Pseudomonadota bacterium]
MVVNFDAFDDLAHIALAQPGVLRVKALARRNGESREVLAAEELFGDGALLFERSD